MITSAQMGSTFTGLTLKAWAQVTTAGVLVKGLNIASVVRNLAGNYTITYSAAMATATYMLKMQGNNASGQMVLKVAVAQKLAASCQYITCDQASFTATDTDHYIEVWE